MSNQGKKISKKIYKVDWIRVLLIGFVIYFVFVFADQQLQINEYNVKLSDTTNKIDDAETRTEDLKATKEKTDDSDYVESVARKELGLVKPYEKIFIDVNK